MSKINRQAWWGKARRLRIGLESRGQIKHAADVIGTLAVELARLSSRNEREVQLSLQAGFSIMLAQRALEDGPAGSSWYLHPNHSTEEETPRPELTPVRAKPNQI